MLGLTVVGMLAGCTRHDSFGPAAARGPSGEPAVVLTDDPRHWRHDHYMFGAATVNGDILTVHLQHGGGCAQHDFALLVRPAFLESHPVQCTAVSPTTPGATPAGLSSPARFAST